MREEGVAAGQRKLIELLLESPADGSQLPDVKDAEGMARFARRFLDEAARLDVLPEAWGAILDGDIHPANAKNFRARDANEFRRSWPQVVDRSASKIAALKARHLSAKKGLEAAAQSFARVERDLQEEEMTLAQLRLQMLLRELARYANAVFAVGPAWALLKTIMVVPKGSSGKVHCDDEAANERMRKKLSAYADDEFMLQYVRLAIMAGIVQYEIDNPHDVRAGAELDGPELRSLMATDEKALFEACLAAASKRTA